jgi:arabinan endo-1,5-alpha-L-arabinosidase
LATPRSTSSVTGTAAYIGWRGARLLPLAAAFLASCASITHEVPGAAEATYRNPVLDLDFPDPAVLKAPDGWFYAYATQGVVDDRMLNIQVARSRDLVTWTHLGDALPAKARWAQTKQKFWAPHVIYDGAWKRYVMYYSAEPDNADGKCLAVATAEAPAGPFADSGKPLLCGEDIENIDPMAFDDPKTGKHLLYWGSGGKPIRVQELAADRLHFAPGSSPKDVLSPEAGHAYRSLIEGAWVLYRDGVYYLFYSGDRCCARDPQYAVMVSRSEDAEGPFAALPDPILERDDGWIAPGHISVATDDAGTAWMLYHAYAAARLRTGDRQRVMLLDRIVWRDGWPRIEGGRPSATPAPPPFLRR